MSRYSASAGSDLLDLLDFGERMALETLRREHPGENEREIERRLDAWFLERPGAEVGDAGGEPFFRSRRRG